MSDVSDPGSVTGPAGKGWIDISVPLRNAMVHWPSDPPVRIERILDVERGDSHTLSEITMGSHTGTHMDAPLHLIQQATGIDGMPLDTTVGRARVIEIQDTQSIKPEELLGHGIRRGERILFKTRNSSRVWQTDAFVEDFVFISTEGAAFLAERGVRLVGVDYLSVGGFKGGGSQTHRSLLEAGAWIIEGLDLSRVSSGWYYLICLPLRIAGGDGAPARAILRPLRGGGADELANGGSAPSDGGAEWS
jgi:arylformamidase